MNEMQGIRRGFTAAMLVLVGCALGQSGPAVYTTAATGGDWDAITWTSDPSLPGTIPGNNPMDVVSMADKAGPWYLNGSRVIGAIGSVNNSGNWVFNQTNPGDTLTLNSPHGGTRGTLQSPALFKNNQKITINAPIVFGTNVTIYVHDSNGSADTTMGWSDGGKGFSVTKTGVGTIQYQNSVSIGAAPVFGALNIVGGSVQWKPNLTNAPVSLASFGSGPMTQNGGMFSLNLNNSVGGAVSYASQPIVVGPVGGGFVMEGNTAGHTLAINDFNVDLGGPLLLGCNNSARPGSTAYNGTFSIVRTNAMAKAIITTFSGSNDPNLGTSGIEDAEDGFFTQIPLVLKAFDRAKVPLAGVNTYGGGTVIDGINGTGAVTIDAASSFGTGDVRMLPSARLRLGAASNVAAGREILMFSEPMALGYVGMAYNGVAPLSADSSGIVGVDTASFSQALDLADIGNGLMALGSYSGGTYGAGALGAGADNRYRLGGGGGTLTFSESDVLSGSATGLDIGSTTMGGNGTVRFNAAQGHALPVRVVHGSTLQGVGQLAADASAFGKGAMRLDGGVLHLINNGTTTYSTNSSLTFAGGGRLLFSVADWQVNSMQFENLVRDTTHRGTLVFSAWDLGTGIGRNEGRVLVSNPPATLPVNNGTGTMAAPYFVKDDNFFLTYGANGFEKAPYTATADLNSVNSANAEVFATTKDQTGAAIVANPTTVHAINVRHNIAGAALTISSGGFIVGATKTIDNPIDFGGEGVVFAYDTATFNGGITATDGLTVFSRPTDVRFVKLNADNTATLAGPITINSAASLQIRRDDNLGALANEIIVNGGRLYVDKQTGDPNFESARTLRTGPAGGIFGSASNDGTYKYNGSIILDGPLAVAIGGNTEIEFYGPIQDAVGKKGTMIFSGSTKRFNTPAANVTYSGGTIVRMPVGTSNDSSMLFVLAGSRLGTGDVMVEQGRLALEDDAAIASSARLWMSLDAPVIGESVFYTPYRCYAYFRSAAPVIGSLEGLGQVVLGNAVTPAANTTLTVGEDDTDSAFYGRITQNAGRVGSLVKAGAGTFTLGGENTYTGATTVEDGELRLVGAVAGDARVAPGGTLSGKGHVGGDLLVEGSLRVALDADGDHDRFAVRGQAVFDADAMLDVEANGVRLPLHEPVVVLTAEGGIAGRPAVAAGYSVHAVGTELTLELKGRVTTLLIR
jgi:autotransporter-associated beta strand protein